MDKDEIVRTINSFHSWYYQFDLNGIKTAPTDPNSPLWISQRKSHFFDPLVNQLGGSLKGKRVLDIGCNAGFWPLQAIESGCDFVMGIDGRQMHIDQANFVFKVKEIEASRYEFVLGNIFDLDLEQFGPFDIVFCLGFFHHVSKQMQLLEKIAQVNSDILLLESRVSRIPGAYIAIQYESTEPNVNALDYSLTMLPTKKALFGMVEQHGYSVAMLRPPSGRQTAEPDYKAGRRRAFLCTKTSSLSNLPVEVEPVGAGELKDLAALGTHWLLRRIRRSHPA